MMGRKIYILCLYAALLCLLASCNDKKLDWSIKLDSKGKKPYDTYLAHNSLKYFFPNAEIRDLSRSYRFSSMDAGTMYNYQGTTVMILTGITFGVSEKEWDKLKVFVRDGNELVIFASTFDNKILESFNLHKGGVPELEYLTSPLQLNANEHILSLASSPLVKYGYKGRSLSGHFFDPNAHLFPVVHKVDKEILHTQDADTTSSGITYHQDSTYVTTSEGTEYANDDSTENYEDDNTVATYDDDRYLIADTLGYANGKPNCLRISMGRGHIILHAAPLVTSNYFLLQDGNINYLAGIWSALPADVTRIYWDDFLLHSSTESSSNILWKYPATRYGLLLALLLVATYILLHIRRKQRIVPVVAPLKNESVSFVETVGRLYYNKRDNANLAEKMIQQFLEWVRMTYHINTSQLNEEFLQQLMLKSGESEADIKALVKLIYNIRTRNVEVTDSFLHKLYNRIQHFYKNHHR